MNGREPMMKANPNRYERRKTRLRKDLASLDKKPSENEIQKKKAGFISYAITRCGMAKETARLDFDEIWAAERRRRKWKR